MEVMTFRDARASLKDVIDRVIHDRVEVVVARKKRAAVVIMSLDEYIAIRETLYLQKSPENERRLRGVDCAVECGWGC